MSLHGEAEAIVDRILAAGHTLRRDDPHSFTYIVRYTCQRCHRAVLVNGHSIYGSATDGTPCKVVEKGHEVRR